MSADPAIVVPDELKAKFSDLIPLILGSESMNDEERQYWINILPVMTPEQVQSLRGILENEKTQLAAIDAKYAKEISAIGAQQQTATMERERRQRSEQRQSAEQSAKTQESAQTEDVLRKIESV